MLWKQGFECLYMPHDVGVVAVVNNCSSSTTLKIAILPIGYLFLENDLQSFTFTEVIFIVL